MPDPLQPEVRRSDPAEQAPIHPRTHDLPVAVARRQSTGRAATAHVQPTDILACARTTIPRQLTSNESPPQAHSHPLKPGVDKVVGGRHRLGVLSPQAAQRLDGGALGVVEAEPETVRTTSAFGVGEVMSRIPIAFGCSGVSRPDMSAWSSPYQCWPRFVRAMRPPPPNTKAQRTGPPCTALMIPQPAAAGRVLCSAKSGGPPRRPAGHGMPPRPPLRPPRRTRRRCPKATSPLRHDPAVAGAAA